MIDPDSKSKDAVWLFILLALAGFIAAVIYFGRNNPLLANNGPIPSSRQINTRQPRTYTVFYGLGVFSPTNIRIHVGDSVRFQNDGNAPIRVVSDSTNGTLDLTGFESVGDIPPGSIFTYTFSQSGIFGYNNAHRPNEEGTVIVRP